MSKLYYFTGKPCKNGHISQRYVSNQTCVECAYSQNKVWQAKNPEVMVGYRKDSYGRHRLKRIANAKQYYQENIDVMREKDRIRREENPEYFRKWWATRALRVRNATPPWVDCMDIYKVYQDCPKGFHIDHIVPIKGKTPEGYDVCGLNVPWNLQPLTPKENQAKNNRMTNKDFELATTYTG